MGKRMCQIHFKEGPGYLGASGRPDWPAVVTALREIDYRGWVILETANPRDVVADTKRNLEYVRKLFAAW
jgi:sugar phosphate isomerase/epimerase